MVDRHGRPTAHDIYSRAIQAGATPNEATVLAGAAVSESALRPDAWHDRDATTGVPRGYGLWGHNYTQRMDLRGLSWEEQVDRAVPELQSRPEAAQINAATTPRELAIGEMHYEQPEGYTRSNPTAGKHFGLRLQTLERLSQQLPGTVDPNAAPPAAAQASATPNYTVPNLPTLQAKPLNNAPAPAGYESVNGQPQLTRSGFMDALTGGPAFSTPATNPYDASGQLTPDAFNSLAAGASGYPPAGAPPVAAPVTSPAPPSTPFANPLSDAAPWGYSTSLMDGLARSSMPPTQDMMSAAAASAPAPVAASYANTGGFNVPSLRTVMPGAPFATDTPNYAFSDPSALASFAPAAPPVKGDYLGADAARPVKTQTINVSGVAPDGVPDYTAAPVPNEVTATPTISMANVRPSWSEAPVTSPAPPQMKAATTAAPATPTAPLDIGSWDNYAQTLAAAQSNPMAPYNVDTPSYHIAATPVSPAPAAAPITSPAPPTAPLSMPSPAPMTTPDRLGAPASFAGGITPPQFGLPSPTVAPSTPPMAMSQQPQFNLGGQTVTPEAPVSSITAKPTDESGAPNSLLGGQPTYAAPVTMTPPPTVNPKSVSTTPPASPDQPPGIGMFTPQTAPVTSPAPPTAPKAISIPSAPRALRQMAAIPQTIGNVPLDPGIRSVIANQAPGLSTMVQGASAALRNNVQNAGLGAAPSGWSYGWSPFGNGVASVHNSAPLATQIAASGPGIFGAMGWGNAPVTSPGPPQASQQGGQNQGGWSLGGMMNALGLGGMFGGGGNPGSNMSPGLGGNPYGGNPGSNSGNPGSNHLA